MDVKKLVHDVQCINGGLTSTGTLRLTDFHLIFSGPAPEQKHGKDKANSKPESAPEAPPKTRESWITFPMIGQCTIRPTPPSSGIPSSIRLRCRDFIFVAFNFPDDKSARDVFDFIKSRTCKLGTVQSLYAFSHKPSKLEQAVNGWEHYDPKAEFRRQGISEKSPDKGWRITWINKDYSFCDTYPAMLVVPSSISDNVLKYAKEYRSRCRIPALSYIHPVNNCSITRCAQPLTGVTRRNNIQDEKLVAASFAASPPGGGAMELPPPPSEIDEIEARLTDAEKMDDELLSTAPVMYDEKTGRRLIYGAQQSNLIVDARPVLNAMVNQVQGMGSEPMDRYPSAKKVFLNIENIHVMRSSLNKVCEALKDADLSPLSPSRQLLASSDWLKHTRMVLQGSSLIARQVGIQHSHVLIHCSDGWDRTSQLSALSQLMLDPYYRTMDGFITLVEKDWVSFGHMFRLRSGHLNHESSFVIQKDAMAGATIQPGENDGRSDAIQSAIASARRFFNQNKDDVAADRDTAETASGKVAEDEATVPKMVSPVFHQFLDCVYQMLRQFPNRFEFNERFLRRLLYHLYSCQYGTFLYNSEKQRHDARLTERTASVWNYFLARRAEFTNRDYDAVIDDHDKERERIIIPDLEQIRWWHQFFNRTDEEMNGDLNAQAAAQISKASAMANFQPSTDVSYDRSQPGTPPRDGRRSTSKPPPSLPSSQSLVGAVETPYATLTPDHNIQPRGGTPTLHRSVSAENAGAFSALREGIGRGVSALTALGARNTSPNENQTQIRTEQELHQMT